MKGLLKIDSIMFFAKDLVVSTEFYTKVLGLKKVWEDKKEKMVGLKFPQSDAEIVLHNDSTLPNPDFSFLVKDVNKFCISFRKRGYKLKLKPINVRCGKYAILLDTAGNKIPIIDLTKFGGKPRYD